MQVAILHKNTASGETSSVWLVLGGVALIGQRLAWTAWCLRHGIPWSRRWPQDAATVSMGGALVCAGLGGPPMLSGTLILAVFPLCLFDLLRVVRRGRASV